MIMCICNECGKKGVCNKTKEGVTHSFVICEDCKEKELSWRCPDCMEGHNVGDGKPYISCTGKVVEPVTFGIKCEYCGWVHEVEGKKGYVLCGCNKANITRFDLTKGEE